MPPEFVSSVIALAVVVLAPAFAMYFLRTIVDRHVWYHPAVTVMFLPLAYPLVARDPADTTQTLLILLGFAATILSCIALGIWLHRCSLHWAGIVNKIGSVASATLVASCGISMPLIPLLWCRSIYWMVTAVFGG